MSGRPNYKRKTDANQQEVVARLRELPGVTVQDLSGIGNGCPDLIVGFLGKNFLIELKDGEKPKRDQKLTDAEKEWHTKWSGQAHVCSNFEDIFKVITNQTFLGIKNYSQYT